jgi:hypothetical protein
MPLLQNGYPLLFAAENEITKDLLGRGLSKDVNTVVGVRPSVHPAAPLRHASAFIRTHASSHWRRRPSRRRWQGNVPLMAAAQHSTTVAMQALLDAGADVNYANEARPSIARLRLARRSDAGRCLDAQIGVTALHVAAKGGKTEAIKLLLQRGAQSEAKLSVRLLKIGAFTLLKSCATR